MTVTPSISDNTTLARILNTDAVIHHAPIMVAIGIRKDTVAKAASQATRVQADIHVEKVDLNKPVAKTIGAAVGRTNATIAIAKAGMAAMVAPAQNAATAKE